MTKPRRAGKTRRRFVEILRSLPEPQRARASERRVRCKTKPVDQWIWFGTTAAAGRIHHRDTLVPIRLRGRGNPASTFACDRITGGAAEGILFENTVS